jgi:hypothetical protein
MGLEISRQILQNPRKSNFTKVRSVVADFFHTAGRTERET